ncbi:MAG TPA: crossover junction endodeoxyribonuclease RuvC [Vicinamibacterales bacterium]|nr:crossover junction endodeoxyribonuclease RuvC [Vicinamibacterales bacterium]
MRIFGIDPGSVRTGYGCLDTDGSHHRLVTVGVLALRAAAPLPDRLHEIHRQLARLLREASADCVVVENLFHARNVRSALVLGHARGVAVLAAVEAGVPVVEYTPAEIKQAVVGYGRAEKAQLQQMVQLLLGLDAPPSPHDAADALAVAICHAHHQGPLARPPGRRAPRHERSWRHARVAPGRR